MTTERGTGIVRHIWIRNAAFARITGIAKVCLTCGGVWGLAPKECPGKRVDGPGL